MADVQHSEIDFAFMHAPAAIPFTDDPSAFVPPRIGFLYFHSPSKTLWRSTGITAGSVEKVNNSKEFGFVTKANSYQLDADVVSLSQDLLLFVNGSSDRTVTVPLDSTFNFPLGYRLKVFKVGDGDVTITQESGVTLTTPGSFILETQYNFGTLIKIGANDWFFLPNGVGGGGDFDSILTDPLTGLVLVDPITGHVLTSPL